MLTFNKDLPFTRRHPIHTSGLLEGVEEGQMFKLPLDAIADAEISRAEASRASSTEGEEPDSDSDGGCEGGGTIGGDVSSGAGDGFSGGGGGSVPPKCVQLLCGLLCRVNIDEQVR